MEQIKAPEKLYFNTSDIYGILDIYSSKDPDDSIEYVRKDAFIERVCEYLSKHQCEYIDFDDLKKYLKGI